MLLIEFLDACNNFDYAKIRLGLSSIEDSYNLHLPANIASLAAVIVKITESQDTTQYDLLEQIIKKWGLLLHLFSQYKDCLEVDDKIRQFNAANLVSWALYNNRVWLIKELFTFSQQPNILDDDSLLQEKYPYWLKLFAEELILIIQQEKKDKLFALLHTGTYVTPLDFCRAIAKLQIFSDRVVDIFNPMFHINPVSFFIKNKHYNILEWLIRSAKLYEEVKLWFYSILYFNHEDMLTPIMQEADWNMLQLLLRASVELNFALSWRHKEALVNLCIEGEPVFVTQGENISFIIEKLYDVRAKKAQAAIINFYNTRYAREDLGLQIIGSDMVFAFTKVRKVIFAPLSMAVSYAPTSRETTELEPVAMDTEESVSLPRAAIF